MGRYLAAILTILSITIGFYIADATAQVQVWNGDLDGSTNANKIVTGAKGQPLPTSGSGTLSWDGGAWYFGPAISPALAGQALWTNDAGTSTTWAYPHGDVDASATDPGALTVNAIQGFGVSTAIPSAGNALVFSSGLWRPAQPAPGWVTLEQYGAVGDGTTNDSAAMTSAISALASGGTLHLGCGKTYLVGASSPYTVPAGVSVVGCGDGSVLKTATNAAVLVAGGQSVVFRNFAVLGNGTGASQIGVANGNLGGGGFENVRIEGCTFTDLGEAGVLAYNYAGTTSLYLGTTIANDKFIGNPTYGLWIQGGYEIVTGIQVTSSASPALACGEGIRIGNTGNAYILSGAVTGCTTGVHLIGGGNDGHGYITLEINHNTTNLLADNTVANGEQFVGTNMYAGDITLTSATGLHFIGGQIDANNYYFDGSIGTVFNGVTFPDNCCANTIHNSYNAHASTTEWLPNNTALSGAFPSWINSGDDGTAWLQTVLGAGIQFGNQRSSATVGTNRAGATLTLQTDAAKPAQVQYLTGNSMTTDLYDQIGTVQSRKQVNNVAGVVQESVLNNFEWVVSTGSANISMSTASTTITNASMASVATAGNNIIEASSGVYLDGATTNIRDAAHTLTNTITPSSSYAGMTISGNVAFSGFIDATQQSAPAAPTSGTVRVYTDSADGKLKAKDSSGNIFVLAP